mgnify:CR=1 FL=1|jgi:hypothetical protein
MSQNIIRQAEMEVNPRNFVPAKPIVEPDEYTQGRRMYYHGKPIAACLTDEQARGWLAAEAKCEAQYWTGMMAQASTQEMN